MVLLGATARVEPCGGAALSAVFRRSCSCAFHNQYAPRRADQRNKASIVRHTTHDMTGNHGRASIELTCPGRPSSEVAPLSRYTVTA